MIFRRIAVIFLFGIFLTGGIAAPVSVNIVSLEAGINAALAAKKDTKAKKAKKNKKAKKDKKEKSCNRDQPCNDDNENRKDAEHRDKN